MRRQWPYILTALFVCCQACAPLAALENAAMPQARLLVKFKSEISRDAAADLLRRHGVAEFAPLRRATAAESTPMDRWWIVRIAAGSDLQEVAAVLRAEPAVEVVEMEGTYRVSPKVTR
jgi:hypothetical protein